jgi:Holliday junction resolvasome RuvABC endonuclease subunit
MLILALDLASTTSFAIGTAGQIPKSGSVTLRKRGDNSETAAFNLRRFLEEQIFVFARPDKIVVEAPMSMAAQKSADAAFIAAGIFHIAAVEARVRAIQFHAVAASTVRKHFIGTARTGDRNRTKALVIARCHQLGLMPKECREDNRADACAVWDYASATFGRAPLPFQMYGG